MPNKNSDENKKDSSYDDSRFEELFPSFASNDEIDKPKKQEKTSDQYTGIDKSGGKGIYFSAQPTQRREQYPEKELNTTSQTKPSMSRKKELKVSSKLKSQYGYAGIAIILVIILISSVGVIRFTLNCVNDILAINRSDEIISIEISEDISTDEIIAMLGQKGLIQNRSFCRVVSNFLGYKDTEYIPGAYDLSPSMGLEGMLNLFKSARSTNKTVTLTFPEGYTIDQIIEKLVTYNVSSKTNLYKAVEELGYYKYDFIKNIPNQDNRYHALEGYLYPDTYEFYVGENATSVMMKFFSNFELKWTDEYEERRKELGMTLDEVVILASIIEKEAYGQEQMFLVSSVLHNRLNDNSGLFNFLQCDATGAYISNISKSKITNAEYIAYHRIYDTYQTTGLPVGAICNPGDAAIYAVLYPTETAYYYFRHDKNRKIYMGKTEAEHIENGKTVLRVNGGRIN